MPSHANKEYGLKCQCHKYFINKIKPKLSTHYRYFCLFHKIFCALFKPALSEDKEIVLRAIPLYICVTADFASQSDPCPAVIPGEDSWRVDSTVPTAANPSITRYPRTSQIHAVFALFSFAIFKGFPLLRFFFFNFCHTCHTCFSVWKSAILTILFLV